MFDELTSSDTSLLIFGNGHTHWYAYNVNLAQGSKDFGRKDCRGRITSYFTFYFYLLSVTGGAKKTKILDRLANGPNAATQLEPKRHRRFVVFHSQM